MQRNPLSVAALILTTALLSFSPLQAQQSDTFPEVRNTQAEGEHPPSPREMLDLFELPPGFKVTLFAGEPDVQQPIAFDFDDNGRIWVAENYTYSARGKIDQVMRDRVIILHDNDGDGEHDERKVFWDKGRMLTGLTWGYGGLWILNDGTLSFIPDKNGDDIPDSEPVPLLNGWTKNAGHNVVNGLLWGPDGWLYGRHGITDTSYPGTIDTPKEERQPMNCGIWRFHPVKHTFEIVCHGTTNPWGLDYNEVGDMFMSNNVIGHLWHVIPGAHYERMFGQDFNPHCYELMGPISDHYHWDATSKWSDSRDGKADDYGGGHSHCGLMLYYGQNFPKEYWGKAFMCNTHGRCVNVDRIERKGSSYVAKHEPNFLKVNTPWFRGVELKYGPAGCVYLSDWSDNGECHDHDGVHRTSGRIYRISYGEVRVKNVWPEDDPPRTISEIVEGLPTELHDKAILDTFWSELVLGETPARGSWHFRKRLRQFAEISSRIQDSLGPDDSVRQLLSDRSPENEAIRGTATIRTLGSVAPATIQPVVIQRMLASEREYVRGAAVELITENPVWRAQLGESLLLLSANEKSPPVLLKLAASLQKLDRDGRSGLPVSIIQRLLRANVDSANRFDIPLRSMLWYGLELHWYNFGFTTDLSEYDLLRPFIRRRAVHWKANKLDHWSLLRFYASCGRRYGRGEQANAEVMKRDAKNILLGMTDALAGRAQAEGPDKWDDFAEGLRQFRDPVISQCVDELDVLFGSESGVVRLLKIVEDRDGDHSQRSAAIDAVSRTKTKEVLATLLPLLNDRAVYVDICQALAVFDQDPRIPKELLKRWKSLRHGAKEAATDTLCSRQSYAIEFTKAIADGRVDADILTAAQVRQLNSFNDESITAIVDQHWGTINETPEALEASIHTWKQQLTDEVLAEAELNNGATLFKKSCATCHKLYGEGGKIGPDLTGGNRANMDYLLSNIINPSGEVPRQYTVSVLELKSGRVLTGVIVGETNQVVNLQTDKELRMIARSEIEEQTRTGLSLMPNGLLDNLTPAEVRDLIAFIQKRR